MLVQSIVGPMCAALMVSYDYEMNQVIYFTNDNRQSCNQFKNFPSWRVSDPDQIIFGVPLPFRYGTQIPLVYHVNTRNNLTRY